MIHQFSVANYRSIRDEAILDLRIPGTTPQLSCYRLSQAQPDVRLPTVAVLIGPNGSGKTTVLRALVNALQIASARMDQTKQIANVVPFLSNRCAAAPTRFSIDLESDWLAPGENPRMFRYLLEVKRENESSNGSSVIEALMRNPASIGYEALLHFPKGRPRRLFERSASDNSIYVAPEFDMRPGDDRLKAVRNDSSVISTLNALNVELAARIAASFNGYLYATNLDSSGKLNDSTLIEMFDIAPQLLERIGVELQCSDLGIRGVKLAEVGTSTRTFRFDHKGIEESIPLVWESDGTQRLFGLLPQIGLALDDTGLAIFDDIDNRLHVEIVSEILSWFRSRQRNQQDAQLLVTSHNVGLLDDLEKEEVFIVEKDTDGVTHVHGAQDVAGLRRDARLYPKYRAGVLGGIPKIG
ncbi:MAG: AAA family ATPase [Gammaproteobacteria bacterium]|nr:AAA family ATPase [Gammaproteobacteria bacterium]MDE0364211.1 AAA family ATPase [Gammaproteobacteria bacterium]